MSFFARTAAGIGVDFGTSSVKVVELRQRRRAVALATYAVAPQPNLLVDNRIPDAVARMAVLARALFQRARVGHGEIVAALPILSVFSTVLELPAMPDRELDAAVAFAAKSYVPSPLKDVVLGWTRIGSPLEPQQPAAPVGPPQADSAMKASVLSAFGAGGDTTTTGSAPHPLPRRPDMRKTQEVFVTAAPRDSVARYTEVFERLELKLAALEVESFPLARSLFRGETRPVLLVDLGDRTTSFSVVDEGYLRINQATDLGGEALTEAIARKLAVSPEDAEQRKRQEGLVSDDPSSPLAAAMRPVLNDFVARGETVRRLYERKRGRPLGKVVLIGGGSLLPGLMAFWSSSTGLPTDLGNPWRGVEVPPPLTDHLRTLGPSFAVAVGLALRAFEPSR